MAVLFLYKIFFMETLIWFILFFSFVISASSGMGGSLLVIPAFSMLLGVKEAIVLSSVLLTLNNVSKFIFYYNYFSFKSIGYLLAFIVVGSVMGSYIMLQLNEVFLSVFLLVHIVASLVIQHYSTIQFKLAAGNGYAFLSGLFSGISGSSGPLKAISVRCRFVSNQEIAASVTVLSLFGDFSKCVVYLKHNTIAEANYKYIIIGILMMPLATWLGKKINKSVSIKGYNILFCAVLAGYILKIIL
jgi:uncharacterized protein